MLTSTIDKWPSIVSGQVSFPYAGCIPCPRRRRRIHARDGRATPCAHDGMTVRLRARMGDDLLRCSLTESRSWLAGTRLGGGGRRELGRRGAWRETGDGRPRGRAGVQGTGGTAPGTGRLQRCRGGLQVNGGHRGGLQADGGQQPVGRWAAGQQVAAAGASNRILGLPLFKF